jgi:hypothetical protein
MKIGDDIMEKILVNKDVFKALTVTLNAYGEDEVMNMHSEDPKGWSGASELLNSLTMPEMAKALYVGYDLRPTPEEAILGFYKVHEKMADSKDYDVAPEGRAVCSGMLFVLDSLGIEIEGVNK